MLFTKVEIGIDEEEARKLVNNKLYEAIHQTLFTWYIDEMSKGLTYISPFWRMSFCTIHGCGCWNSGKKKANAIGFTKKA